MRWPVSTARRWLRRRRSYATVQRAVDELTGEQAANLCRRLARLEHVDRQITIMLARRGQASERAGDAAAMRRYEALLRAGRRVKYKTYPVRFNFVRVPPEMVQEIEEALSKEKDS